MQIFQGFDSLPHNFNNTAVAMGNYDGVHLGHQRILTELVECSRSKGLASCLVTFHPHPIQVLAPERAPAMIMPLERRLELVASLGVEYTIVVPFTPEFASILPNTFIDEILVNRLKCKCLFVGADVRFGKDRAGSIGDLAKASAIGKFQLNLIPTVDASGDKISSSVIRRHIMAGNVEAAANCLGRPYGIAGTVVSGAGRGRGLGFPTANMKPDIVTRLAEGIYAAKAITSYGTFCAAVHLGPIPTFGVQRPVIEAHILDFDGDFVGQQIRLDFLQKIRDIKHFNNESDLIVAIAADVKATKEICSSNTDFHP